MKTVLLETIKEFDGSLMLYKHQSEVCNCTMSFTVYLPQSLEMMREQKTTVPAVLWLSGLTCTDENFRVKAGAQRYAAELGLALIIPDTSPRGDEVADDENYDLGQGAGFYLNATQSPWNKHFYMYDYITNELPKVIESLDLPLNGRWAISGHSMGGHGALTIGMKNAERFSSISAFAPICNPMQGGWGKKAFQNYLGDIETSGREYDACALVEDLSVNIPILMDQGTADEFYPDELLTENFIAICKQRGVDTTIRFQEGYDHSFHFIGTFIGEHLRWHAKHLAGE